MYLLLFFVSRFICVVFFFWNYHLLHCFCVFFFETSEMENTNKRDYWKWEHRRTSTTTQSFRQRGVVTINSSQLYHQWHTICDLCFCFHFHLLAFVLNNCKNCMLLKRFANWYQSKWSCVLIFLFCFLFFQYLFICPVKLVFCFHNRTQSFIPNHCI